MRSARRLAIAGVVIAVGGAPLGARQGGADESADAAAEHRALVERLGAELAERGFPVDLDGLKVEVAAAETVLADLDRQQDLFFPEGHFDCIHVLLRAMGQRVPAEGEAFRRSVVESTGSTLRAYYQSDREALVFLRHELDEVLGLEPIVAHELVHAWQDQRRGLEPFLARCRTLDEVRVAQSLLEGEAEIVALDLLLARTGGRVADLAPEDLESPLEALLSGLAIALPYEAGRRFVLARWQAGGAEAVERCFAEPPPSTEQVLHPEKLGRDHPVAVTLPPWPAALAAAEPCRVDTVGELGMLALLLEGGVDAEDAHLATTGWDGDALAIHELAPDAVDDHAEGSDEEGAHAEHAGAREARWAARWRSVWDRAEDATHFARVLRRVSSGRVRAEGRVVDWAVAPTRELARALLADLRAHPVELPLDAEDARSTAAAEEARRAARVDGPRVADGRWVHPAFGLSVPVPEGWEPVEVRGVWFLMAPVMDGFRDNLSVLEYPAAGVEDLETLERQTAEAFERMEGLELEELEAVERAGRPMLYLQFTGAPGGPETRACVLAWLVGGKRVEVTATVLLEHWAEREPLVRELFAGLRFD